jgi:hypothetical protein
MPRFSGDRRFSREVDLRLIALSYLVLLGLFAVFAYNRRGNAPTTDSASERLKPVTAAQESGGVRHTVYVPIYSSLYLGRDIKHDIVQLTSTLSIRNVSPRFPIVIESVRYYDSQGHAVREHLKTSAQLAALASVEFVVNEADTTGGPGANFLVRWSGAPGIDEPLIEAVMLGRSAQAGISFTSVGRVLANEPQ